MKKHKRFILTSLTLLLQSAVVALLISLSMAALQLILKGIMIQHPDFFLYIFGASIFLLGLTYFLSYLSGSVIH